MKVLKNLEIVTIFIMYFIAILIYKNNVVLLAVTLSDLTQEFSRYIARKRFTEERNIFLECIKVLCVIELISILKPSRLVKQTFKC
jgi:hypothetical protein